MLLAADLALFLQTQIDDPTIENGEIDLLEIPAQRENVAQIHQQATLQQALETMNEKSINALCVNVINANKTIDIIGIVTRQNIESHYRDVS